MTPKSPNTSFSLSFFMTRGSFFIALLLFTFSVQAQSIIKKDQLHFGVTGNIHYSVITGFGGGNGRIAGGAGGFVEIPIQPKEGVNNYKPTLMYIVPQLEFSMLGEGRNGEALRSQYDYIQVPVYAKFYMRGLNIFPGDRIFAMVGPEVGFKAHKNTASDDPEKAELQKEIQDVNFGISVVGGYALPQNLEIFLRIDKGFTDIFDDRGLGKANLVSLGVGVNWIF